MSFVEVLPEVLKKLAVYLKKFQSSSDSAEQFWFLLACELRELHHEKFNYTTKILVNFGQAEDNASFVFLKDLQRRKAKMDDVIQCLKKIKCYKAVCLLEGRPVSPELPRRVQRPVEEVSSDHPAGNMTAISYRNLISQETPKLPPPPVIEIHPKSVRCERGKRVCFHCMASPDDVTYNWYKNGSLYRSHTRNLMINSVNGGDVAKYYCVAINITNSVQSNSASLTLKTDIWIITQPCHQELHVGQEGEWFRIYCHAQSIVKSKLSYEWQRQTRVRDDSQKIEEKNSEELRMWVRPSDLTGSMEHRFRCKVMDSKDPKNFVYSKYAIVKMKTVWLTRELNDINALIGERASLNCKAEGSGTFKYYWLKSSTRNGHLKLLKTTDLPIFPFSKLLAKDKGYYVCQVQNQLEHVDSRVAHVKPYLHKEETVLVTCLTVLQEPCSYVVQKDEPFEFVFDVVCTNSDEPVTYQWYFMGSKIPGEEQNIFSSNRSEDEKWSTINKAEFTRGLYRWMGLATPRLVETVPGLLCPSKLDMSLQACNVPAMLEAASELEHCGPYWCEARAAFALVVSNAVRLELHVLCPQPPNSNWEQNEVSRYFKISNGERFAREKVALLVGNQCYTNFNKLATPENDIRELQQVLLRLNFKVFSLVDLSHADMQAALTMFYGNLVSGSYAFFYYSGHGVSSSDHNSFLVPVDDADMTDADKCFHFNDIIKRMQETYCRPFLVVDACKVVDRKMQSSSDLSVCKFPNNVCYIWSTADEQPASDALVEDQDLLPCSLFNTVLRMSITNGKTSIRDLSQDMLKELLKRGSPQFLSPHGTYCDSDISLSDHIMVDSSLEPRLRDVLKKLATDYQQSRWVPDPFVFKGAAMRQLRDWAELHLTFSPILTNMWCVNAELLQINDKTSSASITFDKDVLEREQCLCVSHKILPLDGKQQHGNQAMVCARVNLEVRGLQKLRSPLKLVIDMCLCEGQQEMKSRVCYTAPKLPFIANMLQTL